MYKDNDGKVFVVLIKCVYLGCEFYWNDDELIWDCFCYGLRYDYKGNWIESFINKFFDEI